MSTEIQTTAPEQQPDGDIFSVNHFEHAQRIAKMLSSSELVPATYKGNIQNTMIAMEMANRIGVSPLMVMQNLYIIQGRPSWSSSFIISAINSCGRFTPLRFDKQATKCRAWANDRKTGDRLEGPEVTIEMATAEGWLSKSGSKWKTMPELMLQYRAAAFFGRLYAPDILMGMQTENESVDIAPVDHVRERIEWAIENGDLQALKDISGRVPKDLETKYNERLAKLQNTGK